MHAVNAQHCSTYNCRQRTKRMTHPPPAGVVTSLDQRPSEVPPRVHPKPKVEIYLDRSPRFEEVMARLDAERQARLAARQREEAEAEAENAVPNGQA